MEQLVLSTGDAPANSPTIMLHRDLSARRAPSGALTPSTALLWGGRTPGGWVRNVDATKPNAVELTVDQAWFIR